MRHASNCEDFVNDCYSKNMDGEAICEELKNLASSGKLKAVLITEANHNEYREYGSTGKDREYCHVVIGGTRYEFEDESALIVRPDGKDWNFSRLGYNDAPYGYRCRR